MLVLGRKENESIIIGDNIRVTIVGRSGSSIRIGVQAPNDIRIVREELTGGQTPTSDSVNARPQERGETSNQPPTDVDPDDSSPLPSRTDVVVPPLPELMMPPQAAT